MSETQVMVGTMTSPPGPFSSFSAAKVTRLADEPEFTNTLCFNGGAGSSGAHFAEMKPATSAGSKPTVKS